MSQIIEAFEKYFRCVKLNMPRVVPPKIGLIVKNIVKKTGKCNQYDFCKCYQNLPGQL